MGFRRGIVFGGEGFQFGRVLAGDDFGLRVDAGFEGSQAGRSLTVRPRGPVDFESVEAVGLKLFFGKHAVVPLRSGLDFLNEFGVRFSTAEKQAR